MAKKAAKPKTKEASAQIENAADAGSESHGRRMPTSKSDAVRMAIAAGFDGPQVGAGYIQSQFGLDVSPEHFSAVKSADKKKVLTDEPKGRPGRKPRHLTPDPQQSQKDAPPIESYFTPEPNQQSGGEPDLIEAMEAMKPLVASLGAEKVKRIVDLLS